jgi:hypothetical protein
MNFCVSINLVTLFLWVIMKEGFSEKMALLMQLHYSRLSEKDRRQYAALESLKLGRGGITCISNIPGVDRKTILQGRKELTLGLPEPIPPDKQRMPGGGRKKRAGILK